MILNINQLRAFYCAAKLKSITLSANDLMVTPPAVTKQIKQLEKNLEMRLMVRKGNSIRLTEVGEKLFKRCQRIFRQIENTENFLEDMSRAKSGVLRIGCPQLLNKHIMPTLLSTFKEMYPGIKIMLDQGTNTELIESILNEKNELAFVRFGSPDRRLKIKAYGSEKVILIAAKDSKNLPTNEISVTRLSTIPLIIPKKGTAVRQVVLEYLKGFNVVPKVVMECANFDLIKELVSQDNGASFMVKWAVNSELQNKTLKSVRILEGSPIIEYGFAYHKRASLSSAAWAFLRLLEKKENESFEIK